MKIQLKKIIDLLCLTPFERNAKRKEAIFRHFTERNPMLKID